MKEGKDPFVTVLNGVPYHATPPGVVIIITDDLELEADRTY